MNYKKKNLLVWMVIFGVFIFYGCSKEKNIPIKETAAKETSTKETSTKETSAKETSTNAEINKDTLLSKSFVVGEHNTSIMEACLPADLAKRVNDIYQKYKSSIQKNREWYTEYSKKYLGSKLPWDEKFGISKAEYDEFISSADKMVLTEKKKTMVSIEKEKDKVFTLRANQDLVLLNDLKIDTDKNCIYTSDGEFKFEGNVKASDGQKLTGRWNGGTWKLVFEELKDLNEINNDKTYGSISISVGQLEKTNETMIYYKERIVKHGQKYSGEEIVIFRD